MSKMLVFKKIRINYCNLKRDVLLYNYTKEEEKNTKDKVLMYKRAFVKHLIKFYKANAVFGN